MSKKLLVLLVVAVILLLALPATALAGGGEKPYKETFQYDWPLILENTLTENPNDYIAGVVTATATEMFFIDELGQMHNKFSARWTGIVDGYECPVAPIECVIGAAVPVPTGERWQVEGKHRYSDKMGAPDYASVGKYMADITLIGLDGAEDLQWLNCTAKLTVNAEGRVVIDRFSCDE